jgi:hypothetical protein
MKFLLGITVVLLYAEQRHVQISQYEENVDYCYCSFQ